MNKLANIAKSNHIQRDKLAHPVFELVEDDLPDAREGPAGALLSGADAGVGHAVVQRVGPQGRVREGGHHRRVVHEPKLPHHNELAIPAHAEVRHSDA